MQKNNRKLSITAATVLVVAVIFTIAFYANHQNKVQFLVMQNAYTDEVYLTEPLGEDGIFSVSYTHSVNKSMVEEYYRLQEQELTFSQNLECAPICFSVRNVQTWKSSVK